MDSPAPPGNVNAPLAKGRREKLLGLGQGNSVSGFTQASAALAERPPFLRPHFWPLTYLFSLFCFRCSDGSLKKDDFTNFPQKEGKRRAEESGKLGAPL